MYLLYCAAAFGLMAAPKRHRAEWAVLAVLTLLLWCNKEFFDRNGSALYVVRASLVFAAAFILLRTRSTLGFYQAIILLCVLITYGALAYDVATGTNIVFDNYGAWMYGFVACQFLGVLPDIWHICRSHYPSGGAGRQHLPGNTRT